jgi:hypothetical protein
VIGSVEGGDEGRGEKVRKFHNICEAFEIDSID